MSGFFFSNIYIQPTLVCPKNNNHKQKRVNKNESQTAIINTYKSHKTTPTITTTAITTEKKNLLSNQFKKPI